MAMVMVRPRGLCRGDGMMVVMVVVMMVVVMVVMVMVMV